MAIEKVINVQDAFLNYLRKNKVVVTIFLLNGVKLNGLISCFDRNVVALKREGYVQLIYKHAISTFCPHGAINAFDWDDQAGGPTTDQSEKPAAPIEGELEIIRFETTTYSEEFI